MNKHVEELRLEYARLNSTLHGLSTACAALESKSAPFDATQIQYLRGVADSRFEKLT